ncbi:acetyl-CoA carboxylase biotin carboxyl carrier protein [Alicyclobacillus sp. SO9]|uniref:acetyl-CoA carboxylase biotin carboxyl carrier protein n=1 Tax=Alicyclobacillus sp. SO9 TaxID=2665646 RepID=UPI0018E7D730|nr:acetyl-CoA carboxylase biotin carboxyl carrier protein [Alicyclobacillus sp. SO9]QQE76974.1 acetyl-CoA carboxylase biotin carboxyl carrier protein [Alicyclobacillus sp. SO9]
MKIGEIRELIRLLDETSLSEVKIETDDMKLLLKKNGAEVVSNPVSVTHSVSSAPVPAGSTAPAASAVVQEQPAPVSVEATKADDDESGIHVITAPMVGTFYRAPSPDADAYVAKGDKVSNKTVVCIVEAMKLMNEIEAEAEGEVVDVLVENGQLVEYGQPMFKIKVS